MTRGDIPAKSGTFSLFTIPFKINVQFTINIGKRITHSTMPTIDNILCRRSLQSLLSCIICAISSFYKGKIQPKADGYPRYTLIIKDIFDFANEIIYKKVIFMHHSASFCTVYFQKKKKNDKNDTYRFLGCLAFMRQRQPPVLLGAIKRFSIRRLQIFASVLL